MKQFPNILFNTDSDATRDRWIVAFRSAGMNVEPDSQTPLRDELGDVIVTDRPFDANLAETRRDAIARGELCVVAVGVNMIADVILPPDCLDRELVQCCRLLGDIARLRRQQRRGDQDKQALTQLAFTDPLTGLANRRAWDEVFDRHLAAAVADKRSICVAIIDLDHFKQVNEQQGFVAGDNVLHAAASSLQASVRGDDFVARLGGDEFALLLEDLNVSNAFAVVERTRLAVCGAVRPYGLTASAGLAVRGGVENTPKERLIQIADERLRSAKSAGRNRTIES